MTEPVRVVNGKAYFHYLKIWPKGLAALRDEEAYMEVVSELDGPPVFAIGDLTVDPPCATAIGLGEFGVGFSAYVDPGFETFGWSSFANPTSLASEIVPIGSGSQATQLTISATQMFASLQPPGVDIIHLGDGGLSDHATPSFFPGFQTIPTPDGAFSTDDSNANFLHNDSSWNAVVTPTSGKIVTWVAVDRSNTNSLMWIESHDDGGGSYSSPTLWSSPYTISAAGLTRTKVANITESVGDGLIASVANAGMVLMTTGSSTALLTRVSDGAGWVINAEPGDAIGTPLWVDANEVWFAVGSSSDPSYRADLTGITRIARTSLGAPTVSRGF